MKTPKKPQYHLKKQFCVSFGLSGRMLDPDSISDRLSLLPTDQYEPGRKLLLGPPGGKNRRGRTSLGIWVVRLESRWVKASNDAVMLRLMSDVLDYVETRAGRIQKLEGSIKRYLEVAIFYDAIDLRPPSLFISAEILKRVGRLGAELRTVHYPCAEDDHRDSRKFCRG